MASTSISGWSGAGSRKFTLTVTTSHASDTAEYINVTVSTSGESSGMDSHLKVWAKNLGNNTTATWYDETAGWSSGAWFTRPNQSYSFTKGWSRSKSTVNIRVYIEGYAVQYSDKSSYVDITIPVKSTYTISYNANGGSGAPASQTKWYGENITLSSTKPERTGYTFQGWATSSSGSVAYAAGATYSSNASVTLYAKWKQITYTISYNANGGSGAPSSQTKVYGTTLKLSSTKPTRTGYTFLGWSTSSTATTATYTAGGTYTANAAATLYAVWQLITYAVTYYGNTNTGGSTAAQTKKYGTNLTLRSNGFTKTGYSFLYWNTKADGTGTRYNAGATYSTNAALDLYAIWQADESELDNISDTMIGSAASISWTPKSSSYTYSLRLQLGSWSTTISSIAPGSTSKYTRSVSIPMEVCNQLPDSTSGSMTATLTTYSGSSAVGTSTKVFTVNVPSSVKPSFSFTMEDVGQDVVDMLVQNVSILRLTFTTAGPYSATVETVSFNVGSKTYSANVENDHAVIDVDCDTASAFSRTITVTDSRGRTATDTLSFTVEEYSSPEISSVDITVADTSVIVDVAGNITPLSDENEHYITINRADMSGNVESVLFRVATNDYEFTQTVTETIMDVSFRNYEYEVIVEDSFRSATMKRKIYPGVGNRFETLSGDAYYVGVGPEGWQDSDSEYTGEITEDGRIIFDRSSGESAIGIGVPIELTEGSTYELVYGVNLFNGDNVVYVSFFDESFQYIGRTEETVTSASSFTAPEGTRWGMFVFGVSPESYELAGSGYREYESISVRTLNGKKEEEIDWTLETGNLGLDTPDQKYISRIQIRIDYKGSLEVGIEYDNDEEYTNVYESDSDHMRSITVPIKVRRCDHFRIKLSGVGQAKVYSFGYITESGATRCLI